jgi:hypothetical protein
VIRWDKNDLQTPKAVTADVPQSLFVLKTVEKRNRNTQLGSSISDVLEKPEWSSSDTPFVVVFRRDGMDVVMSFDWRNTEPQPEEEHIRTLFENFKEKLKGMHAATPKLLSIEEYNKRNLDKNKTPKIKMFVKYKLNEKKSLNFSDRRFKFACDTFKPRNPPGLFLAFTDTTTAFVYDASSTKSEKELFALTSCIGPDKMFLRFDIGFMLEFKDINTAKTLEPEYILGSVSFNEDFFDKTNRIEDAMHVNYEHSSKLNTIAPSLPVVAKPDPQPKQTWMRELLLRMHDDTAIVSNYVALPESSDKIEPTAGTRTACYWIRHGDSEANEHMHDKNKLMQLQCLNPRLYKYGSTDINESTSTLKMYHTHPDIDDCEHNPQIYKCGVCRSKVLGKGTRDFMDKTDKYNSPLLRKHRKKCAFVAYQLHADGMKNYRDVMQSEDYQKKFESIIQKEFESRKNQKPNLKSFNATWNKKIQTQKVVYCSHLLRAIETALYMFPADIVVAIPNIAEVGSLSYDNRASGGSSGLNDTVNMYRRLSSANGNRLFIQGPLIPSAPSSMQSFADDFKTMIPSYSYTDDDHTEKEVYIIVSHSHFIKSNVAPGATIPNNGFWRVEHASKPQSATDFMSEQDSTLYRAAFVV